MADRVTATLVSADEQRWHQRNWRAERIGRGLLLALLLAGALGLLGSSGPFAKRTIAGAGLSLHLPRILRHAAASEMTLRLDRPATEVWISRDYLDQAELRQVLPIPLSSRWDGERCVFAFSEAVDEVSFTLDFAGYRPRHGLIGTGETSIAFTQWMLP